MFTVKYPQEYSPVAARGRFLLFLLLMALVVMAGRLFLLQVMEHDTYAKQAADYVDSDMKWPSRRGAIVDDRGRPFAVSLHRYSCAFDPGIVKGGVQAIGDSLQKLQKFFDLRGQKLDRIYSRAMRPGSRFVWINRRIDPVLKAKLQAQKIPGVFFVDEYERAYPQKEVGAHVIGFTDTDGRGLEGVERVCNSVLAGESGSREVSRDAVGRPMVGDGSELLSEYPGCDVRLSIDSNIQALAQKEIQKAVDKYSAKSACALVMDPQTGDVLAMAAVPGYDPSNPTAFPTGNRLNPLIASVFEPGSIFKPFGVAAALQCAVVKPQTTFNCEWGSWRMPDSGRVLHDTHGYGQMSVEMILVKSSNIGVAKIAAQLGREKLHAYLDKFGFGRKTGFVLPGEINGTLRPVRKWTSYSMGSVPMGQEVAVTPLQVVTAYCALANGGYMIKPRLVKEVYNEEKNFSRKVPVQKKYRIIGEQVARDVLKMLERTVSEGTGKRARLKEYKVGGKTGTAQLAVNAEEYARGERGYSATRYASSFVGLAPIRNPRLVVLVSVREPKGSHYGGTVAAPAVKSILSGALRYLRVEPEEATLAGR